MSGVLSSAAAASGMTPGTSTASAWILLALLLLPLVGGVLVSLLRDDRTAKITALVFSLAELVLVVFAVTAFEPSGARLQMVSSVSWIPEFGIRFSLGLDGISLVMIALLGLLTPIVIGGSWEQRPPEGRSAGGFFALLLLTQAGTVGVFAATDVFLFYVFFEVVLIPMYFLIGRFGQRRRQYAAMKFFLYSFLGGMIMLASVIGLYAVSADQLGEGTLDWAKLTEIVPQLSTTTQIWLFLGFFLAFAIKAPLVPLHTWLPDSTAEAPIGAGVLLVGVLDKIGTFGFLRYCLPLFPAASRELAPLVLVLSVIGILYGALLAVGQDDLKRLLAYVSIAHFGFIGLGIFAFTSQSLTGSVLYMVNHGIATGMLFLVVGMVIARGGSRLISAYGGMSKLTPLLAGTFLIAGLAALSLPGTNSFVSEFLVLIGSFGPEPVYTILATIGMILAALDVLWAYQRVMQGPLRGAALVGTTGTDTTGTGPESGGGGVTTTVATETRAGTKTETKQITDLNAREIAVLAPLVALILALGFYPKPVLDVITPSVDATVSSVSDSVPSEGGN